VLPIFWQPILAPHSALCCHAQDADEELQSLRMPPASPANRRYVDSSSSNTPASGKAIRRRNSPQEGGAGGIGTAPLAMLAVTVVLSVMVLLQMIARDLSNDIGRCEQLKIPKHHRTGPWDANRQPRHAPCPAQPLLRPPHALLSPTYPATTPSRLRLCISQISFFLRVSLAARCPSGTSLGSCSGAYCGGEYRVEGLSVGARPNSLRLEREWLAPASVEGGSRVG